MYNNKKLTDTTIEELPVPVEYQEASLRFRWAWIEYKDKEEEVKGEIIFMVKILEDEGYSRTKAIQKIVEDHKDLKGFSRATIYRELPDKMKNSELGRPNISNEKLGKPNNYNVTPVNYDYNDDEDEEKEQKPITTRTLTTTYDVKDGQTLPEEKEKEEPSLLVVDLPPPEPELQDPKITTFVGKLPKSVLRLAEKIQLSPTKLELIANYSNKSILKDHRPIQENLVKRIAPLTTDQAKIEISQAIRDLETGAIQKIEGQSSYVMDYYAREKIPKKPDRVKHPIEYYLELVDKFKELMYLLTGHKLNEDEIFYEPNHVDNTEKHRQEIVNHLDERQKTLLYENAELLSDAVSSLMDIINGGSTTRI